VSLRHAVLAVLLEGEASGYELAKRFDVSVANFWRATPQQLYADLPRLEAARLIHGRAVRQHGKPDKRVYTLTDAGAQELAGFVAAPAKPTAIKDQLLVKVQAADAGDVVQLADTLRHRAAAADERSRLYEELLDHMLNGRDETSYLTDADRIGPYLTCKRGLAFEHENREWCRWAADVLSVRASRPQTPAEPAQPE
jgi:DNA-binding PadR family transcriptional regulator